MGTIARALRAAAEEAGATVRTSTEVRSINVENGQACGVTLVDGTSLTARTVVANANAQTVFLRLVDKAHLPAEFVTDIRNIRTESSCFKINLAVEQLPTWAGLDLATCGFDHPGSITIAENLTELEEAFESARHGRMFIYAMPHRLIKRGNIILHRHMSHRVRLSGVDDTSVGYEFQWLSLFVNQHPHLAGPTKNRAAS